MMELFYLQEDFCNTAVISALWPIFYRIDMADCNDLLTLFYLGTLIVKSML